MAFRFIIGIIILLGISYFTAKMYGLGFRFGGVTTRATFLAFLMIPLLFFVSIISTRSAHTGMGPIPYTTIQILAGIGFYLFLGAIILGVLLLITNLLQLTLPLWVPVVVLIASLGLAGIGLIQSRYIATKEYSVTLPNAPASWNGKTAVLVTDTHFGLVNYKKFSNKVVDKIIAIHPDFVLHAGDFYDGPTIATTPITDSWKRLTATAPVFFAPGNHEEYGDYSAFLTSISAAGVTVVDDKKVEYDGVQIAGITYRAGKENVSATQAIEHLSIDPTIASILINHPPTSVNAAANAGISLMVSGHTHNGQFWPNQYLVRKIYGIFAYGLNNFNDMQVLTSSGVGTFGPPFRTFNTPEVVVINFKVK